MGTRNPRMTKIMSNSRGLRRDLSLLILVPIIGLIAPEVQGADSPASTIPKGYVAGRAPKPLTIDGKLDDEEWAKAPWTDDFVDIEGDKKPRPRLRTRAKMLWDDQYFYVAAELSEPNIWGTLKEHDKVIFQDNDFEVFIDPDGDNHAYYEMEMNALNTTWDLLLEKPYRNGGPAVNAWEIPGMRTGVKVNGTINDATDQDTSWTVEIAMPWKVLGERTKMPSPPSDGDQWRVNFSRVEWEVTVEGKATKKVPGRPENNWVWSPQGFIDMHRPEHWGFVQFSKNEPGTTPFRLADDWSDRELLMRVYHAQQAYHAEHKAWAKNLSDLKLDGNKTGEGAFVLATTAKGYTASIVHQAKGDQPKRVLTVREDSLLTRE